MNPDDDEPSPSPSAASHAGEPPDDLLDLLAREGLWRRPLISRDALVPIGCLLLIVLSPLMIATCLSSSPAWFAVAGIGLILFILATRFAASRQQKEAVHRLVRTAMQRNDLRIVGRLVEALSWPEPDVRRAASAALVQLLPLLKASDASLLNADQRLILYRWLRKLTWHSDQLSILKALEQIGDAAAIPYVEWLARRRARTPRQHEIRAAAHECLITLRSRAEQAGQGLLRPAGSPDDPTETLLRPAGDTSPSDPGRLLRPTGLDPNRLERPDEPPEKPEEG